ncbi:MAG TPA: VTT domain-containing protein [Candidatus Sulfopaludibacter sp.]|jgi:membrane protein DedA with SNARE-associated domain/rhodanese-related sulfurtransferase|nr:VTT domain-containing protein [Candidatus Sulfopaludibacter sp.]
MHALTEFLVKHGYVVVFGAVFVEQIGLPVPSGPVLLAAGALAGLHRLSPSAVLALALLASLICDSVWYLLGQRRGSAVMQFMCRVSLEPNICISKTKSAYTRYGPKSLVFAKFVPWLGTLAPPMAGMFKLAPWKFGVLDGVGALAWSGAYFLAGWVFREQLEDVATVLSRFGIWSGVGLGAALAAYIASKYIRRRRIYRSLRTHRMTPNELKRRLDAGEKPVIVDLRPDFERRDGVIPGAIAATYDELDSLPASALETDVVFYCSCPDEISAVRAALRLQRRGAVRVHPLQGGFAGWRDLGFPVNLDAAETHLS